MILHPQELRPLLWFQFFTSEEDKALQQWEAGALGILESTSEATEASGTPSPALPDNLAWVPKHFNPQLRAAELEAERARDASMLSLKSPAGGLRSPGKKSMLLLLLLPMNEYFALLFMCPDRTPDTPTCYAHE